MADDRSILAHQIDDHRGIRHWQLHVLRELASDNSVRRWDDQTIATEFRSATIVQLLLVAIASGMRSSESSAGIRGTGHRNE
jgi:hypothetical protein